MISKILLFLFIISIGMIQVSFLTTWPDPIRSLNLILLLSVFIAIIFSYKSGLWYAFGSGLFLELYSSNGFGLIVLSLFLTVVGINMLFKNFFTNRSIYSLLLLGFIATVIYNIIFYILSFILVVLNLSQALLNFSFFNIFFWQPLLNLLVLGIIFVIYQLTTNRIRSMFIMPNNNYENQQRF